MQVPIAKDFPDHHDAELVLKTYELRREATLREARRMIATEFWPKSLDDLLAIAKWDHPQNPLFRQFTGYWELVYGMARHGIVHAEYLAESSGGEGLMFLAKVDPFLEEFRKAAGPWFLRNTEWIATNTEAGRELFARLKGRVSQLAPAR